MEDNGELKVKLSPIRPWSRPGLGRLTQHRKATYRRYEGRPSGKLLDDLSTLRKFSEWIYAQKLMIQTTFHYLEV